MHRYTVSGIARDVEQGKRVVVFSPSFELGHQAFSRINDSMNPNTKRGVKSSHGCEEISTIAGGFVWFYRVEQTKTHRVDADVVVIEDPDKILTLEDHNIIRLVTKPPSIPEFVGV